MNNSTWVALACAASAAAAAASDTILNPAGGAPPTAMSNQLAAVEGLKSSARCEVNLVGNGVLQYTAQCAQWPLVQRSKGWRKDGGKIDFLDAEGGRTVRFVHVGRGVFLTPWTATELLRLTFLPPPKTPVLQDSAPLGQ